MRKFMLCFFICFGIFNGLWAQDNSELINKVLKKDLIVSSIDISSTLVEAPCFQETQLTPDERAKFCIVIKEFDVKKTNAN